MLQTIDDMPGPEFLIMYGGVILSILAICWFWASRQDPTRHLPTPPISKDFDPLEIAYLRGGENAVTRLVMFGLIQQGYLEMVEKGKWFSKQQNVQQAADHPDIDQLTPLERIIFDHFKSPCRSSDIFPSLPNEVEPYCIGTREYCEANHLLSHDWGGIAPFMSGALFIVGLGGFKLVDALGEHRSNVVFLIIMGIVGLVLLAFVCGKGRLTNLGKRYLEQCRRSIGSTTIDSATGLVSLERDYSEAGLFLAVAAMGLSALDDTEYSYFKDIFPRAGSGGMTGGCGGGCGGGGGGGGCGGCGGG